MILSDKRPHKPNPLSERLTVRFRCDELIDIERKAGQAGLSPSAYVRSASLNGAGAPLPRHLIARIMLRHPEAAPDLQDFLDKID
jgi:hypothetical protein